MSKKIKKVVLPIGALTLVGAIGALTASQLAFLTDSESTSNTFTIGDVSLDVIEPNYPGNDSDEVTHIVPNKPIKKDPQIVNTGDNNAVAFAEFSVPIQKDLIIADDTGLRQPAKTTTIFEVLKEDGTEGLNDGWNYMKVAYKDADGNLIKLSEDTSGNPVYEQNYTGGALTIPDGAASVVYLVGYDKVLDGQDDAENGSEKSQAVFSQVKLKNIVEGQIDNTAKSIEVTGMAIQSEWLGTNLGDGTITNADGQLVDENKKALDDDNPDGKIPTTSLSYIYDLYFNQNKDVATSSDANSSNALDLKGNAIGTKLAASGWGDIASFPATKDITVTVTPTDDGETGVDRTVTVESNNPNVATVSAITATGNDNEYKFTISAKEAGYATITVKTADGAVLTKQIKVGTPAETVANDIEDKDNSALNYAPTTSSDDSGNNAFQPNTGVDNG